MEADMNDILTELEKIKENVKEKDSTLNPIFAF
jgi:uncharacterized protein YoxC